MIRGKRLVYNTFLLTCSSLLMSLIGMAFQVWLVGRIGPAGIGLYQLVLSVTALATTFAVSGIRFAATRLVSEELGKSSSDSVGSAMGRCLGYAAFFGFAAGAVLWLLAEPLGFLWIGDARTVRSLRISALSMPCAALCACVSGYFTACGRVWKPTLIHLIEQLSGIALVAFFLGKAPHGDIEASCTAVTLGRLAADILALVLMLLSFLQDRLCYYSGSCGGDRLTGRMLRIALPLAVSAYTRSALTTVQNLLVPRGLKAAGYSADGALSGYGTVHGMVLPIIFFPSCIMSALAELIVPELTEAQMRNADGEIRRVTAKVFKMSGVFSLTVALVLYILSDILGQVIYHSAQCGYYIRVLAPLVPVMYMDMCIDGFLKGLGQQMWCMGINIIDALTGLLMVWQLLPRWGLPAYIVIIYLTEILNFMLSFSRLRKII